MEDIFLDVLQSVSQFRGTQNPSESPLSLTYGDLGSV